MVVVTVVEDDVVKEDTEAKKLCFNNVKLRVNEKKVIKKIVPPV